jgi:hypothetical protein
VHAVHQVWHQQALRPCVWDAAAGGLACVWVVWGLPWPGHLRDVCVHACASMCARVCALARACASLSALLCVARALCLERMHCRCGLRFDLTQYDAADAWLATTSGWRSIAAQGILREIRLLCWCVWHVFVLCSRRAADRTATNGSLPQAQSRCKRLQTCTEQVSNCAVL